MQNMVSYSYETHRLTLYFSLCLSVQNIEMNRFMNRLSDMRMQCSWYFSLAMVS